MSRDLTAAQSARRGVTDAFEARYLARLLERAAGRVCAAARVAGVDRGYLAELLKRHGGKVWLLPYMTNKSTAQANPEARTWYDELIISRERIADP